VNAPIILIHYGNSSFLPYVIQIAKRSNPTKDIVFLGDEHNSYLSRLGVKHYLYEEYAHGSELELFDHLYPSIENRRYAKTRWANFILRRWFIINQFIKETGVSRFWTFDSDNFLLTDLENYEAKFSVYDCTSQCKGICLNGFVPESKIVQRYVTKINELLSRKGYASHWQQRYREKPDLFYTEMEAFDTFVKEERIRNLHIAKIENGAAFEDSITYVQDGMEMYEKKIKGRWVKKLYLQSGKVYCKHLASGRFIKMNNLNLSWMPKYVFPLLFNAIVSSKSNTAFTPVDLLKAPFSYHLKFFVSKFVPVEVRDRIGRGSYWI
jgi:hypothetical protein